MSQRRKSTKAKIIQHTFRKDRDGNRNEPEIEVAVKLDRPTWLDDEARAQWDYYWPILRDMGVITRADVGVFTALCISHSRLKAAEREIALNGLTVQGATGVKKNPACTVADEAIRQIRLLSSDLGLSPASRPGLSVTPPPDNSEQAEAARRLIKDG